MSLIGWWRFNGNLDDSKNDYNAIEHGTLSYTSGKLDQCITLDGTSGTGAELLQSGDAVKTEPVGGYSFWFKSGSASGNGGARIISRDASEHPTVILDQSNSSGNQYLKLYRKGSNNYNISTSIETGVWYHVAVTWDENKQILTAYLNGTKAIEQTGVSIFSTANRPIVAGGNTEGDGDISGNEFIGEIDDVRVFDHVISSNEAKKLSQAKYGHWKLSDNKDYIDNIYTSDNLSGWGANNGSIKNSYTDNSIPSHPESSTRLYFEKDADSGAGESDQWHGTYKSSVQSITAQAGDKFTFSGWYRLNATGSHLQDNLKGNLYATNEDWNNYGSGSTTMRNDNTWHRFEFTVELSEDKEVSPSWQWPYDHGPQTLELCGLQIQYAPAPSDNFLNGQDTRNGRVTDSSGYGNHATNTGIAQINDSPLGTEHSYYFNGSNYQHFNCGNIEVPKDAYTLSVWVKGDLSEQNNENIYGYGWDNKVQLRLASSGSDDVTGIIIRNSADDGYNTVQDDSVNCLDGTWNHIAATVDRSNGNAVSVYLNGQEIASGSVPSHYDGTRQFNIGSWSNSYGGFTGKMADSRLYMDALSSEEVKRLYENRASIDNRGTTSGHEIEEYESRTLARNKTYDCKQDDYEVLATFTPAETNYSDWVESDDTLGNIVLTGEVYVTDPANYVLDTIEFTKDNNDKGVFFKPNSADSTITPDGWQKGWNEIYCNVSSWDNVSNTPWENMDRLQLYRTGDSAGDTTQKIRIRNLKIHKLPQNSGKSTFSVSEKGSLNSVEFNEIGSFASKASGSAQTQKGIKDSLNSLRTHGEIDETRSGNAGTSNTVVQKNLYLHLNAGNSESYPGSGTTWYDLSGNNYDAYGDPDAEGSGTDSAQFPEWQTENGGRFYFDGSQGLTITSDMGSPSELTIEVWLKRENLTTSNEYLSDARNGSGTWQLTNYNNHNINVSNSLEADWPQTYQGESHWWATWTHIVFQSDGSSSRLFINGEEIEDERLKSSGGFSTGLGQYFRIGNRYTSTTRLQGYIGEYRIYNRMLNQSEIAYNYNLTKWRYHYG
jgi:hypothetical protein